MFKKFFTISVSKTQVLGPHSSTPRGAFTSNKQNCVHMLCQLDAMFFRMLPKLP